MFAKCVVLFLLLNLAQTLWAQGSSDAQLIGEARSLDGEKLLYRELHYIGSSDNIVEVHYVDAKGTLIAEKTLSFFDSALQPRMRHVNHRCGEEIKVDSEIENAELEVQYQGCGEQDSVSKTLALKESLVVDAGFDALVQQRWQELQKGAKIGFEFLAPSRLSTLDFTLQKGPCAVPAPGQSCFIIAAKAWWVRWALEPIHLHYEPKSKRLLRYRGLGNIADSAGDYLAVDITYSYP